MNPTEKTYIGDGVYVQLEGGMVKLSTQRSTGEETIYLEHDVLQAFENWLAQVRDFYKEKVNV